MASILIVDDNATNRLFLRRVLEHGGHTTLEAEEAVQGLALARTCRPDLIVIDLSMPDMSGVDFIKTLRAEPATRETRIVLYTGSPENTAMRDFMALTHTSGVIPKPSRPAEALRIVNEALANLVE